MTVLKPGLAGDEQEAALLLRQAGAREDPGSDLADEVFRATHAAWRTVLSERRRRRRTAWSIGIGMAATVVLAVTLLYQPPVTAPALPQLVGQIARVEGQLEVAPTATGPWAAQPTGTALYVGQLLMTGPQARAALALDEHLSVRIDHDTQVALIAADTLRLDSGALYVDAAPDHQRPLTIQAAHRSIRHLGTQYSVRITAEGLDIAVREGEVLIEDGTTLHTGEAMQRIHLAHDGLLSRSTLTAHDPQWQWARQVAPTFDIEGRTLALFLEWVARETGKPLVYDSDDARISASQTQLSGSIAELDIDTALRSVLASTQLRQDEHIPDALSITLAMADEAP